MEEPSAASEPSPAAGAIPSKEDRAWALAAHLGATVGSFVSGGMLAFVVPLVIFLAKRDESEFVGDQAKESLNFRITLTIGYLISLVLAIFLVGFCLLGVIWIVDLIFGIIAGIKAYDGERYRYPFAIRLVD